MYPVLYVPNPDGKGGKQYVVTAVNYYKNKVSSVMYKDGEGYRTVYDVNDVVKSDSQLDLSVHLSWEQRYDSIIKTIQSDIELELKSSNRMAQEIAQAVIAEENANSLLLKDYIELNGVIAGKTEVLDRLV